MLLTIIVFVLILGLLIFVHELGHFAVAKFLGVKVEEFAFGFPPRLISWKKGETRYAINLLPIGGYVKLYGEEQNVNEPRSFHGKPVWARLAIIVAGVFMNFILAIILLTIGFTAGMTPLVSDPNTLTGQKNPQVMIAYISPDSAAQKAGLEPGDIITGFSSSEELRSATLSNAGKEINLEVIKKGKTENLTIQLSDDASAPLGVGTVTATVVKQSLPQAFVSSIKETGKIIGALFNFLGDIIKSLFTTGTAGQAAEGVVGPVGLFNLTSQAIQIGWIFVLQLVALLSINLGIINILPFPALDGGKVLFLALEGIFRRKVVRAEIENVIHMIGFILLILLLVTVTYRDILNLR